MVCKCPDRRKPLEYCNFYYILIIILQLLIHRWLSQQPERRGLMVHYVLLKFKKGTDLDAAEKRVRETYDALDETLDFFNDPAVYRNCVERDSNADIMASARLDSADQLQDYLTHPLHVAMGQDLNPMLEGRTSFDHA